MSRKALVTGITGQDGSYLAEYLLTLGYEVHGTVRSKQFSFPDCLEKEELTKKLTSKTVLHSVDLMSYNGWQELFGSVVFDEVYHLAAQSHVGQSFLRPEVTMKTNVLGTLNILEALRNSGNIAKTRFYFAGSSEMFGNNGEEMQGLCSEFHPESPYAISKKSGYDLVRVYGDSYGLQYFRGILFNHESPRRHGTFVTRKITRGLAEFKLTGKKITLGNLSARRDWGYAPEYMIAVHKAMQMSDPIDFVLGTGVTISVLDFLNYACKYVGVDPLSLVNFNSEAYDRRPNDVQYLRANTASSESLLDWQPKILVDTLIEMMVDADMKFLKVKSG